MSLSSWRLSERSQMVLKSRPRHHSHQPQTMEDYLLSQLEEQVVLKDGSTLKGQDGHVMTMTGLSVPVNREAA